MSAPIAYATTELLSQLNANGVDTALLDVTEIARVTIRMILQNRLDEGPTQPLKWALSSLLAELSP